MIRFFVDFWPLFVGIIIGSIFGYYLGNSIVSWGSI